MLTFKSTIAASKIPMAGKGLFTQEAISKGQVLVYPNQEHTTYSKEELANFPEDSIEQVSAVRWFEKTFSVDPDWSEESHLNHSFTPNALWHLGFVFALKDIPAGGEITIDYSYLLDQGTKLDFNDSVTGRPVEGTSFPEKMARTCEQLAALYRQL
jgi:hypothetical protein